MRHDVDKYTGNIAQGSIYDVANSRGEKTANVLANADVVVVLDISGSMNAGGKHQRATEALRQIQQQFPGRVALIEFNDVAKLNLRGVPGFPTGGTGMYNALMMAKDFDGLGTKFYLISDGEPTDSNVQDLVDLASQFTDKIHTIFIGDDYDTRGQNVLKAISAATKGESAGRVDPKMLGETVIGILTSGK